jgi:DNA-directed RNA polymerase III subunit RPC3
MYKLLYNVNIRHSTEMEEPLLKSVLEKRERTDVGEDETLLSRMEKDVLFEWERRREKLRILELRVDETVFVVRDFCSQNPVS